MVRWIKSARLARNLFHPLGDLFVPVSSDLGYSASKVAIALSGMTIAVYRMGDKKLVYSTRIAFLFLIIGLLFFNECTLGENETLAISGAASLERSDFIKVMRASILAEDYVRRSKANAEGMMYRPSQLPLTPVEACADCGGSAAAFNYFMFAQGASQTQLHRLNANSLFGTNANGHMYGIYSTYSKTGAPVFVFSDATFPQFYAHDCKQGIGCELKSSRVHRLGVNSVGRTFLNVVRTQGFWVANEKVFTQMGRIMTLDKNTGATRRHYTPDWALFESGSYFLRNGEIQLPEQIMFHLMVETSKHQIIEELSGITEMQVKQRIQNGGSSCEEILSILAL